MQKETHATDSQPYTILRIKRKRTDEPLDALVVDSSARRKKSRGGMGVFQFAQTIEENDWDDKLREALQNEISRLAREPSASGASPMSNVAGPPSPIEQHKTSGERGRRYTIVEQEDAQSQTPKAPNKIPEVLKAKDLEQKAKELASKRDGFKLYDAVIAADKDTAPSMAEDPEIDNFMPMLNDYLKLHDMAPESLPATETESIPNISSGPTGPTDDYVWDIFYHRPVTLSQWNAVAANVGTLTSLPASLVNPNDSDSDSEVEDEADEDSNAEEYYKNDYPDEESDDESGR